MLEKYLTDYDDSLTGESNIDPMGTLVIWSAYGKKIFENRVNSISNDVRNYTLNLFNHYIVRRLIADDSVQLSRKLRDEYGSKDTLYFKHACLLYLENLFVFSILEHESNKQIDSLGVLGSSNARRLWTQSDGDHQLNFTHEKPGQILVRQLGLGVSGRYKTPLMGIGYFDKYYHYTSPSAVSLWQEAEQFVLGEPALKKLADSIITHLKDDIFSQKIRIPKILFSDVPLSLRQQFAKAFASSAAVGSYAREYWLKVTKLDTGAAGALLKVLNENAESDSPKELSAHELMDAALKKELSEEERLKMAHIAMLEPFLSDIMLIFTLLAVKKSHSLNEVITFWHEFGRDEYTLPRYAQRLRDDEGVNKVINNTTAGRRMEKLLKLSDITSLEEQISLLLDYHKALMQTRGQVPWLTKDDEQQINVHVRPFRMPAHEKWQNGDWYHSYYLPQFKSLVRGFQGIPEEDAA